MASSNPGRHRRLHSRLGRKNDCKEEQKEKSVHLEKPSSDRDDVSDLFVNFIDAQEIQHAYINSSLWEFTWRTSSL